MKDEEWVLLQKFINDFKDLDDSQANITAGVMVSFLCGLASKTNEHFAEFKCISNLAMYRYMKMSLDDISLEIGEAIAKIKSTMN